MTLFVSIEFLSLATGEEVLGLRLWELSLSQRILQESENCQVFWHFIYIKQEKLEVSQSNRQGFYCE